MKLLDYVTLDCIRAPLQATDKRAAIQELVALLAKNGRVKDGKALEDAVWAREQTRTTGIGLGLAIPHGKCSGVNGLAISIGKPAQPLEFNAIDGKPVQLVVLLASPPDKTPDHIQALAHISRLMNNEILRERMYRAATPEEILGLLTTQESN